MPAAFARGCLKIGPASCLRTPDTVVGGGAATVSARTRRNAGQTACVLRPVPELPEVETIARGLANAIVGKTIAAAAVSMAKIAVAPAGRTFAADLPGEQVTAVGRRAKFVVIALASGRRLVVHLRMTGRLIFQPAESMQPYPYTHISIDFTDGTRVAFADVRQFGRMRLLEAGEAWDADGGIEPLSEGFTCELFVSMLDERRTPIKAFLLDQSRISGVGNIYACEALWEAGIRPSRPAHKVSRPARRRLHNAIRGVWPAPSRRAARASTIMWMPRDSKADFKISYPFMVASVNLACAAGIRSSERSYHSAGHGGAAPVKNNGWTRRSPETT